MLHGVNFTPILLLNTASHCLICPRKSAGLTINIDIRLDLFVLACTPPPVNLAGIRTIRLLLILVGVLSLAGCSGVPSWLQGSWQLDHDRTQRAMEASNANSGGGFLSGMSNMLGGLLLPQLDGTQVLLTSKERIVTINGQGKSEPYEVVNRSSDQCTIKLGDGTVETYYRDGDEIYTFATGGAQFKIYLKRQP